MEYRSLYRAYRPKNFSSVVGQEHVTTTLQNALRDHKLSHAYLFTGIRGTGKTSLAKILSKAVNCKNPLDTEPCNQCSNCIAIDEGHMMDVFEIDAASNRGIDEIRDLRENTRYLPAQGNKKVYIIDEVHMLTNEAFNALLKTLEEPPSHVLFLLATTDPGKLPATILSRCQRFDLKRIQREDMERYILAILEEEAIAIDEDALHMITIEARGAMRDALTMVDQCMVFAEGTITKQEVLLLLGKSSDDEMLSLATAIEHKNFKQVMTLVEEGYQKGNMPQNLLQQLLVFYRNLLFYKNDLETTALHLMDEGTKAGFCTLAAELKTEDLLFTLTLLSSSEQSLRYADNGELHLETVLIQLMAPNHLETLLALGRRVSDLEKALSKAHLQAPPGSAPSIPPLKEDEIPFETTKKNPLLQREKMVTTTMETGITPPPTEGKEEVALEASWLQILGELKKDHRAMSLRIYKEGLVAKKYKEDTVYFTVTGSEERGAAILNDDTVIKALSKAIATVMKLPKKVYRLRFLKEERRNNTEPQGLTVEDVTEKIGTLFPDTLVEIIQKDKNPKGE